MTHSSPAPAPLPPGSRGWPLLGETLGLLHNPYAFIQDRHARYGRVFRTRLVGRDTVFLEGPAAWALFIDPANITRQDAHPAILQRLFGGQNVNTIDDPAHRIRKHLILQAFTPTALAAYVPVMQQAIAPLLARWARREEVRAGAALPGLALAVIARTLTGQPLGPRLAQLRQDYTTLLAGGTALPLPLPFTRYGRALHALTRIRATWAAVVQEHRQAPPDDGLARILAATAPDGTRLEDAQTVLELHHIVVAGFAVHGLLTAMILHLTQRPDVRTRVLTEIRQHAADGPLTLDQLTAMPYLLQVVLEVKRVTPIISIAFGRAARALTVARHTIPAGWRVWMSVRASNLDAEVYTEPLRFDPDRFVAGHAEADRYPFAFSPQGAGDPAVTHHCAAVDYTTYFLMVFTTLMLRGYTWELPPQRLAYRWDSSPPAPRDGLRLRLRPLAGPV
jgi:cytochrome P450